MANDIRGSSFGQAPVATDAALRSTTPTGGVTPAERQKVAELAREFEAFFVHQMIRQMRESMLSDESGNGLGADTMTSTVDVELSRQLAGSGGIGLASVLVEAIERQAAGKRAEPLPVSGLLPGFSGAPQPAATRANPFVSVAEPHTPTVAVPLPLTPNVSSSYGWRRDPFDGMTRFHAGVDIRAAYGKEVPAAGSGAVVFAGTQGGYGNTVVIEHPGGVRTRYAHLASIDVTAGSRVETGAIIGRVGSTGRSTGPHLHFEVLQDGQPVNPEVAATRYAGQLKLGGVVADLPFSQPSIPGVAVGVDDEDSGQ
jgi:murein DD-endopeptidase MepM/ murein hydrolase activator NlpD